jgi:transposase
MLSKHNKDQRHQLQMVTIDDLVPADHLVRKIEASIDFDFIYDLVETYYSKDQGRPSIDPVVLIKIVLIQYLFGIRSMRQTIKEIETNVAYRWFLGYGLTEKIPHFSTFGKNYVRRFQNTDLFEKIFYHILQQAIDHGLVDAETVFIDSTPVKANANKKKYIKKLVRAHARTYQEQLEKEIEKERLKNGKKPLTPKKNPEMKEVRISKTDPESGYFVKNERERMFAYSFHTGCDKNGFVLGVIVEPSNIHDSQVFLPLYQKIKEKVGHPRAVAVDAGYKTPHISKVLFDDHVRPVMPYTRPHTKKGFFRKHDYVYDEYYNCYICPANEVLTYRTTTREGYHQYVSNPKVCKECPYLSKCTQSKSHMKQIHRHIWQDYLDEVEHLRHTDQNKQIYEKRKETIERVFADMKEKHGMRWTTLRTKRRVQMQAMLVFAAMNLKKLANWRWRGKNPKHVFHSFLYFLSKKRPLSSPSVVILSTVCNDYINH